MIDTIDIDKYSNVLIDKFFDESIFISELSFSVENFFILNVEFSDSSHNSIEQS